MKNFINDMNMMYIVSIALQLAGAIILMLQFWGNTKKKVIDTYYPGCNIAERDKDNKVTLEKEKLQKCAMNIYLNRVAFMYIVVGYLSGVYANLGDLDKKVTAMKIAIVSALLIFVGKGFTILMAKLVYRKDEKIDVGAIENDVLSPIDGDDILKCCFQEKE